MKLRIKGNSIRLRLTKTEVQQFAEKGIVEEQISFGLTAMTYQLQVANTIEVSVSYTKNTISVVIPTAIAKTWTDTEQVGIEAINSLEEGQTLRILIEKDFACLVVREHEDDSDAFENPIKKMKN